MPLLATWEARLGTARRERAALADAAPSVAADARAACAEVRGARREFVLFVRAWLCFRATACCRET